jgi:hypothetical protein
MHAQARFERLLFLVVARGLGLAQDGRLGVGQALTLGGLAVGEDP